MSKKPLQGPIATATVTDYARARFRQRAAGLRMDSSDRKLARLLQMAEPERTTNPTTQLQLLQRELTKGGKFYAADGWRFVQADNGVIVTIERQKSHENIHGPGYLANQRRIA